jgi:two-component system, sensor histidine kinase
MNDPSQCTPDQVRLEEIASSAAASRLANEQERDALPEVPWLTAPEFADHARGRFPRRLGQERGMETGSNVFVTIVSHELRNSLGAVRSAARILRAEASARTAAQARTVIERQVDRMASLVQDLIDASQSQHGPMQLHCERGDLCSIAAAAAQTVEFTMQLHHHRMAASFPHVPVWVRVDAARLEQAFVNLLLNAAKYTPPGGNIRLSVAREGDEAVVRVRDNGIGIDPDTLPRVFDLFVRADQSSSRTGDAGLGIGLALVRSVVDRHSGRVTATSAGRGCGSEFVVHLPLLEERRDGIADQLRTLA